MLDSEDVKPLLNDFNRNLYATKTVFKRYLYNKINWNARLIGIKGARGVGKTTLMLQYIKENFKKRESAFYASLDNMWFNKYDLADLIEYLYNQGVTNVFIDEVHKLKDWQRYLKNFYDNYPDLKIVYTGSAMLAIDHSKADLSRRQTLYNMNGLSFREYLEFNGILNGTPVTLEDLLQNHIAIAEQYTSSTNILSHFAAYLQKGYYPFFKEAGPDYYSHLADIARVVIDTDVPAVEDVEFATLSKLKRLLMVVAGALPFVPNISKLSEQLQTSRDYTIKMLNILDRAGLLICLNSPAKTYKHLASPQKIYLDNSNIMYALSTNVVTGTARETFFANQLKVNHSLMIPQAGDFFVDEKYTFEVGGNKKSYRQIADMSDSFLAVDDMAVGWSNRIPLWLFGWMY